MFINGSRANQQWIHENFVVGELSSDLFNLNFNGYTQQHPLVDIYVEEI